MLLHMLLIMLFTIPVALRELAVADVTRLFIAQLSLEILAAMLALLFIAAAAATTAATR